MVQVTHIRAGGLGQTILEDEFVDLFFPRLSAAAVLPLVEVKTIPSQAMAGGAMLMAGESVVAAAEPINYNTSLPSWVRFINIFVAAWFFIGSLVGIIFSLSWINVYGLEFFTFLVNIPLLMYSFYLAAIEIRAEKFGMGAFMHRLHTDYFPFLVSKQRTGRFVTDILMAVVAIQLYQTAIVPISQPNAQYVQVFSGIVLIVGTLFNQFMDTYRAAPKFQLLFDKLRPHLQVDGSFTDDQRAERAYRAICAVANVSELNNEGLSKLVNALKVDLSQHEFELLQFHLDSNCDSTVQVQELTHWLAQYAQ
jgi:MFS family permease